MPCGSCGGVAHPATGCQYSASMLVCGPCVRAFWAWARVWTNQGSKLKTRGGKKTAYFYEAAGLKF